MALLAAVATQSSYASECPGSTHSSVYNAQLKPSGSGAVVCGAVLGDSVSGEAVMLPMLGPVCVCVRVCVCVCMCVCVCRFVSSALRVLSVLRVRIMLCFA